MSSLALKEELRNITHALAMHAFYSLCNKLSYSEMLDLTIIPCFTNLCATSRPLQILPSLPCELYIYLVNNTQS